MKKYFLIIIILVLIAGVLSLIIFLKNRPDNSEQPSSNSSISLNSSTPFECNKENCGKTYCENSTIEKLCAQAKCIGCGCGWVNRICEIGCENGKCIQDKGKYVINAEVYTSPDFNTSAPLF